MPVVLNWNINKYFIRIYIDSIMDKKVIKGIKKTKLASKEYMEALSKLKQASMNNRIIRKQN